LNDHDDPLVGISLEKGETIHVGSLVRLNSHIAKVQDCAFSPRPSKEHALLRWNALSSSFVKGDWSSQHSATLLLRPLAKRLVLLDGDGTLIDARFLLEGEHIDSRVAFEMPVHKVIVGKKLKISSSPSMISKFKWSKIKQLQPRYLILPSTLIEEQNLNLTSKRSLAIWLILFLVFEEGSFFWWYLLVVLVSN
jgi:hypothetical protein